MTVLRLLLPSHAVVVLCGPAAAGKSTFAARHFGAYEILSSDALRGWIAGNEADQSASPMAFRLLRALLRERARRGVLTAVDSTALDPRTRRGFLRIARQWGRPTVLVCFDTPPRESERRNVARPRVVPSDALAVQHLRMQRVLARAPSEGWDAVCVVTPEDTVVVERASPTARPASPTRADGTPDPNAR